MDTCAGTWNKEIVPQLKVQTCNLQIKQQENPS